MNTHPQYTALVHFARERRKGNIVEKIFSPLYKHWLALFVSLKT